MHLGAEHRHRWGVILAGGEGARLRPLTRFVLEKIPLSNSAGSSPVSLCYPKQVNALVGGSRQTARSTF